MKVSFAWLTPDDRLIPEGETAEHAAELRRLQDEEQWQEGRVLLEGDGGDPALRFTDPLGRLVGGLALDAVPALAAGQEFETDFYGSDGVLRLTPDGEDVVVSGASGPLGRFRRAELLPALTDCAARYVGAMRLIHDSGGWREFADQLEAELNAASGQPRGEPPPVRP
jgi:hypothetical protein